MKNLTIITPCSRPENLPKLQKSIDQNARTMAINWIVVYDNKFQLNLLKNVPYANEQNLDQKAVGYPQRNHALDLLKHQNYSGWVWVLDDDNIMHPDFASTIIDFIKTFPKANAFVFNQLLPDDSIRIASPENMRVGYIDQAQYILHTDLIGDRRYGHNYEADGNFIVDIYNAHPDKFVFIPHVICYYNYLNR